MSAFRKAALSDVAYTLPGHYYTSIEIYREEMSRFFACDWVCVGRIEQLAHPGDYMLVNWANENLILTCDRDNRIHALFNVCRHRGTRLCTEAQGQFSESIQCPYHAWTYGLDGRLLNARNMYEVDGFDHADYPLRTAAIAEWEGFLFINLASEPVLFEVAFAPLINKFTAWHIPDLRVGQRIEYDVRANWKMIVQNYSECYHCPLIHPALAQISHWQSGRNDLSEGPFLGGYMLLNEDERSMTTTGQTSRPALVTGENVHRVYYYAIFPTMLLSLHPDYVMVHTLWPDGPARTRVVCEWLFAADEMAKSHFDPSDAVEFWDMTNRQDWHVCELSQEGVSSRAYTPGPYAQQEGLLYAFDQEYLRRMGYQK
ncbi:MAG: aromatic ring-hydroxylating dioxygenase subunit alpha [Chloroflexi bacterium AL-W]|nr:aromatic ring-hydroxylating dioxygenase subunit alpha [Chloroflexi bacterium AL-N1]NOK67326.1 aromatic ring-hydroxylating dioxygenase subunit alpha [Chloroflexi bacterium AL-N10]NOK75182.1 aromatic ring-hydroxylating dioxygenase subunit alpha [Chloroflexi bacterium AL-N5]NOK81970.1 aromatic ring-hydroxylating dioxygenase subunit alpha [Chloroflexi bacterium AL-W]NOK89815.1 aromatic ring-hydroxylating dioxygenase subunit alpha [Chloroflexi bacterium AL-N15]